MFFNIGKVYNETRGITKFRVTQKDEILNELIPYLYNNPLQGRKALQFTVWVKIVNILATERVRTLERDRKIDNLIRELSNL